MQDKPTHKTVATGEVLWDLLPDGAQLGGAPTNFAYHAHALGADVALVSCVGQDPLGRRILDLIGAWAIDTRFLAVVSDYPTGTVAVQLDGLGVPEYVIHENVAWDHIRWLEGMADLAADASAVCYGSLCRRSRCSHQTINRFLQSTRPECLRVCDINLRQPYFSNESIADSIEHASVLKLNDEELVRLSAMFADGVEPREALARLAERFSLRLIALTRGPNGSILFTPNEISDHPGFPVRVVDTIGAGDAFTAALVVGLLRGDNLDRINDDANRLAASVCARSGAIPE